MIDFMPSHSNKYSTVYRSNDGTISSSNHLDLVAAMDELDLLRACSSVSYCVLCFRKDAESVAERLKREQI